MTEPRQQAAFNDRNRPSHVHAHTYTCSDVKIINFIGILKKSAHPVKNRPQVGPETAAPDRPPLPTRLLSE
jgi:hypothetical protein